MIKDFKHIILSILLSFSITTVVGQDSIAQQNNESFEYRWKDSQSWKTKYYPFKANNFSENKWFHLYQSNSLYAYVDSQFLINKNFMKNHKYYYDGTIPMLDFLYNGDEDSFAYSPEEVFSITSDLITKDQDPYVMSNSEFIRNFDSIPKYIKALVIDPSIFIGKYDKNKITQILEKFVNVEYIEIMWSSDNLAINALNAVLEMPTLKNLKYLYIPTVDTNQLSIINDKCTSLKALWVDDTRTTIEQLPNPFMANADIHFLYLGYNGFLKGNELRDINGLQTLGLNNYESKGGIDNKTLQSMTNLKNLYLGRCFSDTILTLTKTKLEYVHISSSRITLIEIKKARYLKTIKVTPDRQNIHINLIGTKSIETIELYGSVGIKLTINSKIKNLKTIYVDAQNVEIISKKILPEDTKLTIYYIQNYILPVSRNKGSNNTEIIQSNAD